MVGARAGRSGGRSAHSSGTGFLCWPIPTPCTSDQTGTSESGGGLVHSLLLGVGGWEAKPETHPDGVRLLLPGKRHELRKAPVRCQLHLN